MAISGYLETFSLPEVFQILERGQKTGRLTIWLTAPNVFPTRCQYIWFKSGRIVAVSDRSDFQGLLSMLLRRQWLSKPLILKLYQQKNFDTPLGLYLKSQGILRSEQIKLLFHVQVLQRICALFKVHQGYFTFEIDTALPAIEMTGLSVSASEAVLLGLRVLKDWTFLEDKFPLPTSALRRTNTKKVAAKLDSVESKVWDLADGITPLSTMTEQLSYSMELLQQAALRLMIVGLLDEVVIGLNMPPLEWIGSISDLSEFAPSVPTEQVSQSLLQTLMTFLKSKVS